MQTHLKYVRCLKCFTTKLRTRELGDVTTCETCLEPMEFVPYPFGKGNHRAIGFATYAEYLESDLWERIRGYLTRKYRYRCVFCRDRTTELYHASHGVDCLLSRDVNSTIPVCWQCRRHIEFPNKDDHTRLSPTDLQAAIARLRPTKQQRKEVQQKQHAAKAARKLANKDKQKKDSRPA